MILRGGNLEEVEVEYKKLSEYPFFKNEEKQEVLRQLEQLYFSLFEESKKTEVKPFPHKDDKVEIVPGMVYHRCSNSIESLRDISQHGILASEWFGKKESGLEGVFCAFVSRIHSEEYDDDLKRVRAEGYNKVALTAKSPNLTLFFDSTNPVMEKLLRLDRFEYVKNRDMYPQKLTELYTKDELEIFEQIFEKIIEPYSRCGKDFHKKDNLPQCEWSAIPGGIPPTLVNGICTKSREYDKEYIDEIAELFPNATIFNGDLEILHTPKKEKSTQELAKETLGEQEDIALLDEIQKIKEKQNVTQRDSQEDKNVIGDL